MSNMRIPAAIFVAMLFAAPAAHAGAAPEEVAGMLYDRGYRHIQIDPGNSPGYRAYACKRTTHFRVDVDAAGNIVDVDPVGKCDRNKGPKEVHVQAPFTDVQVGKSGVRVRAPFVDIRIPKR